VGVTCTDLKNRLRSTTLTERERSVCRLVLDMAGPELFTVTVKFICESIGFSTENVWPKVRNLLTEKGILISQSEALGRGEKRWHLNFDFTPLAAGLFDSPAGLSTDRTKTRGSRARARDPLHLRGSRDPLQPPGSRDPAVEAGLEPEALEPKIPTTKEVVVSASTEKEERLQGLAEAERRRVMTALEGAHSEQVTAFYQILAERRAGARDPVGLSIGLARLASRGELRVRVIAPTPDLHIDLATTVCAAHADWRGHIAGPSGVLAVAQAGDAGLLRDERGAIFAPKDSARFWRKVNEGDLDFIADPA